MDNNNSLEWCIFLQFQNFPKDEIDHQKLINSIYQLAGIPTEFTGKANFRRINESGFLSFYSNELEKNKLTTWFYGPRDQPILKKEPKTIFSGVRKFTLIDMMPTYNYQSIPKVPDRPKGVDFCCNCGEDIANMPPRGGGNEYLRGTRGTISGPRNNPNRKIYCWPCYYKVYS